MDDRSIQEFSDDAFRRVLCVAAHPDDMEYGTSSAVAAWTAHGVEVAYLLLTRGEAGLDSSPPERTAQLRRREQIEGSRAVGVTRVDFLDHPPPRPMISGITALQGRALGVPNAVLFRAWDFQSPPPIALEALQASLQAERA